SEANDVTMQGGQAALLDRVELAFWDNKTDLEIIAPVEENEQFPVAKKAKRLWRVVFPIGKTPPEDVAPPTSLTHPTTTIRVPNSTATGWVDSLVTPACTRGI